MRPNAEFHLRFALSPELFFRRASTAQMTFRAVLVEHLSYRRGKRAIQFRQTRANSYPHARFSVLPIRFALSPELLFRRASTAQMAFRAVLVEHLSCRRGKRAIQFRQTRAQILIRTLDFQSCRFASRFLLNFSFVALPPRRWRSARFWSSTFPTAAASERSSSGRRARKSLCTVVLPTASFAAHARTVAPVFSTYSAAARTRLSTSRFMAIPLFSHFGRKRARL